MSAAAGRPVGFDDPFGSMPELPETAAAALHELSERLTAANNYIGASLRLSELADADRVEHAGLIGKALMQLDLAREIVILLRKLMQEEAP